MNVRVPDDIRDWYKEQGEIQCSYTNYTNVVTQIYERKRK